MTDPKTTPQLPPKFLWVPRMVASAPFQPTRPKWLKTVYVDLDGRLYTKPDYSYL